MERFYWLKSAKEPAYSGYYNASHKWALPGLHCSECGATWSGSATAYPSVDLSVLPERAEFEWPRPEPYDTWARLRELVRPLVPPGAQLLPGACFGPLEGTASGTFGQLFLQNPWELLIRREALTRLQAEGGRGLKGWPTELRFRQKKPPELLEMEIIPQGFLHPDCLPADRPTPCAKCGRRGIRRPDEMILEAASLPTHMDLFRLADFETTIVCTERFQQAALRLGLDGVTFHEVAAR
jgi:uncharacterized double-CXXCG motif protein